MANFAMHETPNGTLQVASASPAMYTIIICSANFLGPPLGGILIDHISVPATTTLIAVAVVLISSLALFRVGKYIKPGSGCCIKGTKFVDTLGTDSSESTSTS